MRIESTDVLGSQLGIVASVVPCVAICGDIEWVMWQSLIMLAIAFVVDMYVLKRNQREFREKLGIKHGSDQ